MTFIYLFFILQSEAGQLEVKKQRAFERELNDYLYENDASAGAHHVLFTPGSDKLIIVTVESRILIVDLSNWQQDSFDVLRKFEHHRGLDSEGNDLDSTIATVVSITVSSDGQWLATADDENRVHVFNLDSLKVNQ